MKPAANRLDAGFQATLDRRQQKGRLRRLTLAAPDAVDFSSNGYLSLSTNPQVKQKYTELLQSHSTLALGSGGSRLLDGNSIFAEQLERDVATFHGAPAGLLFNSGFEANTGLFSCMANDGDVVIYDEYIHASVHDGLKLSRAAKLPFRHNTVWDATATSLSSLASLEAVLEKLLRSKSGADYNTGTKNVFIAVEGVYSMDGDAAPMLDIVQCVKRKLPHGNGLIIVDEAHSTGIMGKSGRGLVCQLGLEDEIWARVHTFGKAMGCSGAMVLCSETTRSYLINYARSLIYTTAMGFPTLAAIRATYNYLMSGEADALLSKLHALVQTTHHLLSTLCKYRKPANGIFGIDEAMPQSPIIPLFTSKARDLATHCQRRGFMLRPIVFPTVPKGTDRVRLCLHAGNTLDEVTALVRVIEEWVVLQTAAAPSTTKSQIPSRL